MHGSKTDDDVPESGETESPRGITGDQGGEEPRPIASTGTDPVPDDTVAEPTD